VYDERSLVVATTFPILSVQQLRNDLVATLSYRRLAALGMERPILHVHEHAGHRVKDSLALTPRAARTRG
jgi:hypothetical protein